MSRIRIANVMKCYGSAVVIPGLTLNIDEGEFFTLLGPSGCGKTTLLRMIAGFNSIEAGEIYFNDLRINDVDPSRRNIGMVFQNYAVFPHLSVRQNVAYGLKNRKLGKAIVEKDTELILKKMQLDHLADRMPDKLSGGQQQRVALARALVIKPNVLLMDEPLSNLDAKLRMEMRGVIREIQRETRITTVYVTHDQEEAMSISDTIAVMHNGEIQHIGSPKNIYQRPANLFVATFIGRTNILDAEIKGGALMLRGCEFSHDKWRSIPDGPVKISVRPEEFVVNESSYSTTLGNSIRASAAATVTTMIVGVPLAYFFSMYRIRCKGAMRMLIIISSMSPPFIGAYSWILLLGRKGVIREFITSFLGISFPDIYGFRGILLVFTVQLYSLVFLYVEGAIAKVDNSLLEAALSLGDNHVKRFFKIVLPLIIPTVLASALLVFMRALSDFGTPMLLGEGYRTFPVVLYNEFVGEVTQNKGFASAIALIAVAITAMVFLLQKYISTRRSHFMESIHPINPIRLTGFKNVFLHAYCYIVIGIAILPQGYVFYTSLLKTRGVMFVDEFSLDSYVRMTKNLGGSIINTLFIPFLALAVVVVLAVLIAYTAVRRSNVLTGAVDMASMVPYIVPGTVMGIALLTSFNRRPLLLSGGIFIMVLALVLRRLPYTIRSSSGILQQLSMSTEEASISLGAGKLKTFFFITIPIMSSGIISGAILSWVTMIGELSTAMILYTGRTRTISVAVYEQIIRGNYGTAAALTTVLTIFTITSLMLADRINKGKGVTM